MLMHIMILTPGFVRRWAREEGCDHLSNDDLLVEFERRYREHSQLPQLSVEEKMERAT